VTDADRPAFAEALHVLAETFNEPVSDVRAEAYFHALADMSFPGVKYAVLRALRTCKFFPRPVELRELVTGDPDARADAAWAALVREVQRVGYLGTPAFDDARVLDAIRDVWGSWSRLCKTLPAEGPELVGWMKQFKSAYRSLDARAERDRVLDAPTVPPQVRGAVVALARSKAME
jgi:hypothetical protein